MLWMFRLEFVWSFGDVIPLLLVTETGCPRLKFKCHFLCEELRRLYWPTACWCFWQKQDMELGLKEPLSFVNLHNGIVPVSLLWTLGIFMYLPQCTIIFCWKVPASPVSRFNISGELTGAPSWLLKWPLCHRLVVMAEQLSWDLARGQLKNVRRAPMDQAKGPSSTASYIQVPSPATGILRLHTYTHSHTPHGL